MSTGQSGVTCSLCLPVWAVIKALGAVILQVYLCKVIHKIQIIASHFNSHVIFMTSYIIATSSHSFMKQLLYK